MKREIKESENGSNEKVNVSEETIPVQDFTFSEQFVGQQVVQMEKLHAHQ